jgi:hypothetical protein
VRCVVEWVNESLFLFSLTKTYLPTHRLKPRLYYLPLTSISFTVTATVTGIMPQPHQAVTTLPQRPLYGTPQHALAERNPN